MCPMRKMVNPCGNLARSRRLPRERIYPSDLTFRQGVYCQVEYTANSAYRFYHALE
jgi:hypothetical protein